MTEPLSYSRMRLERLRLQARRDQMEADLRMSLPDLKRIVGGDVKKMDRTDRLLVIAALRHLIAVLELEGLPPLDMDPSLADDAMTNDG